MILARPLAGGQDSIKDKQAFYSYIFLGWTPGKGLKYTFE
jgi:hypothetical protein